MALLNYKRYDMIRSMRSFLFFGGVEIETHNFKCQSFFVEGVGLVECWFADHGAEIAFLPFLIISFLPKLFSLFQTLLQIFLVLSIIQIATEVIGIIIGHVSVCYLYMAWTDTDVQRFT